MLSRATVTGLIALLVAGAASAAPTATLIWTATTGSGITGSSTIDAALGDTLTLDIQVMPDENVLAAGVSLDYQSGGSTIQLFYRPEFDGIVEEVSENIFDITFPSASAGTTVGGYAYVPNSAVTCPGPPALGNLATGFCGNGSQGSQGIADDLGGGIVGSFFATGTTTITAPYTLGQAQFVVIPEPATCGLLALGLGALALSQRLDRCRW